MIDFFFCMLYGNVLLHISHSKWRLTWPSTLKNTGNDDKGCFHKLIPVLHVGVPVSKWGAVGDWGGVVLRAWNVMGKKCRAAEGEEGLHFCACPPCLHTHTLTVSSPMFLNLCWDSFLFYHPRLPLWKQCCNKGQNLSFHKQFTAVYWKDLRKSVVYCLLLFELLLRLPKLEIGTESLIRQPMCCLKLKRNNAFISYALS